MAMTGPLYAVSEFVQTNSLWFAAGIGLVFGFILERAGFGDARNLTNIFYFRDMRVLRVMFTAVVTALVGLVVLSWLGLFDYSLLLSWSLLKTYLWPQLVGGLLCGLGFIIGGYCPGTSVAGMGTGKLDGVLFVLGLIVGVWVFAAGFDIWGGFYKSANLGRITLWQVFGISKELMALLILIMALVAFYLAGLGEKWAPYDK